MAKKIKPTTLCDYRSHDGAIVQFRVPAWILAHKDFTAKRLIEVFERSASFDESHPDNDDDACMQTFSGDILEEGIYASDIENDLNISYDRAKRKVQRAWLDGRKARSRFERTIRKLIF